MSQLSIQQTSVPGRAEDTWSHLEDRKEREVLDVHDRVYDEKNYKVGTLKNSSANSSNILVGSNSSAKFYAFARCFQNLPSILVELSQNHHINRRTKIILFTIAIIIISCTITISIKKSSPPTPARLTHFISCQIKISVLCWLVLLVQERVVLGMLF